MECFGKFLPGEGWSARWDIIEVGYDSNIEPLPKSTAAFGTDSGITL